MWPWRPGQTQFRVLWGDRSKDQGQKGSRPIAQKKNLKDVKVMKPLKDNLMFHNHPLPNSKLERGTCWNCKHCQGRRNHRNSDWVSRCETRIVWNHSGRKPRILNTRLPWKDEHLEIKFVHACSVPDGSTCWWSLCCSIPFFARSQGSFVRKEAMQRPQCCNCEPLKCGQRKNYLS